MACCERGSTHDVHIVVNCLTRYFIWSLEKTTDIDIKSKICETRCNDFSTAIVTILAHFGYENSWIASLSGCKVLNVCKGLLVLLLTLVIRLLKRLLRVCSTDNRILGYMATIHFLKGH